MDHLSLKSEDSTKLKEIFKDIEYAIFGIFLTSKESKKLQTAAGGHDEEMPMSMPPTPTRVKTLSESGKVDQIQKQAEEDHVERIRTPPKTARTGLKIITPSQLITRLPILLAQRKAGNSSQKLNNEIR